MTYNERLAILEEQNHQKQLENDVIKDNLDDLAEENTELKQDLVAKS